MASANSVPVGVSSGGNASSSCGYNVFVYGSLLADDVVRVLLRRIPQNSPSTLHGYHRFSIKGRVYPAILPVENKKVTGRVLLGITAAELDILDKFEDVEYEKRVVDVSLLDMSDALQAYTYVWANPDDPNLYGEWDFEAWKESKMKDFVNMTMGFVEEHDSKPRVATYESYYNNRHKE
ncbi:AIG2-like protein D [Cynara cardunculus var. scolymus]|uniref:Putative gamma-glutamylcyclotransferase n=1 Tax=Cynara cardunculus var. scolymus TaxID=59895 RepID=A0A124SBR8_CYNCS|nr:AIG2-like protein D [Cynara cardunculus var. scolymus]KVH91512.1 AIG2-like protein [Cynara cardunculus var. scolymus]